MGWGQDTEVLPDGDISRGELYLFDDFKNYGWITLFIGMLFLSSGCGAKWVSNSKKMWTTNIILRNSLISFLILLLAYGASQNVAREMWNVMGEHVDWVQGR